MKTCTKKPIFHTYYKVETVTMTHENKAQIFSEWINNDCYALYHEDGFLIRYEHQFIFTKYNTEITKILCESNWYMPSNIKDVINIDTPRLIK